MEIFMKQVLVRWHDCAIVRSLIFQYRWAVYSLYARLESDFFEIIYKVDTIQLDGAEQSPNHF